MVNDKIVHIHGILMRTTCTGLSEPESDGNEWVLHNLPISRTGNSLSDGLVSYVGHSLGGIIPVYSCEVPADKPVFLKNFIYIYIYIYIYENL